MRTVLIQGAGGALGRAAVESVLKRHWKAIAVAYDPVPNASETVVIPKTASLHQQFSLISNQLGSTKLDGIFCLAGGFVAGDASDPELLQHVGAMYSSSVEPSFLAVKLAAEGFLVSGGLVVLPGSAAAERPTPWGLAYGSAKAAVHHLVRSLKDTKEFRTVGIAPTTLDTPKNRRDMPNGHFAHWTPCPVVAERLCDWLETRVHAENGAIYKIESKDNETRFLAI
jgi:dihydropteridine reductase